MGTRKSVKIEIVCQYCIRIGGTEIVIDEKQAKGLLLSLINLIGQDAAAGAASAAPERSVREVVALHRRGQQWTHEEYEQLRKLLHTDRTYAEIAAHMGRTAQGIQVKVGGDHELYAIRNGAVVEDELETMRAFRSPTMDSVADVKTRAAEEAAHVHLAAAGKPWTEEDDELLRTSMTSGGTLSQAALVLRKPGTEVRERWQTLLTNDRRTASGR